MARLRQQNIEMEKIKSIVLGTVHSDGLGTQMGNMVEYAMFGTKTDPMAQLIREAESMDGMSVSDLVSLKPLPGVLEKMKDIREKQNVF